MNNNMEASYMPGFLPGPGPIFPNPNYNQQIKTLENRVYNLEREVNRLKSRVSRLENGYPVPLNKDANYSTSYQAQEYNMM